VERGSQAWLKAMRAYAGTDEDVLFLCDRYVELMRLKTIIELRDKEENGRSKTTGKEDINT
jgi:hypothetical protein